MMRSMPILVLIPALLAGACSERKPDDRLAVAVSILPQTDLIARIGGEHVRVVTLVMPGESPATYQPSDRQVSEVLGAKVYFRLGVPFENGKWLTQIGEYDTSVRVVDMREGITLRRFEDDHEEDGHDHGGADPHSWLGPENLKIQAATIARVLAEVDPENGASYRAGLARFIADVEATGARIARILAPCRGRRIYVFHPSWGYFCDAYGLEQVAIEVSGKEPSEAEITAFVASARADGVRRIFVQQQISGAVIAPLAKAIGAEVVTIDPLAPDVLANLIAVAEAMAGGP
jgi:zinc transport system substrate-binding protein